jgi:hypothetical protein
LLLVRRAERPEGFPLSATVWRGTPPLSGPVWVRSPRLFSGVWLIFTAVLLLYRTDDLSGREPRLLRSHWRSPLCRCLSAAACAPYSAGGLDLRRGGDVVRVRLCPRYVTAQRETSATPWRSGYGDTSSPRSFKARAGSYGQLAWSWLSNVPFFSFCTSTWMPLKAWIVLSLPLPISSPQLTAAAGNYAYANLRFWEGQTSPWRPAADVINASFLSR